MGLIRALSRPLLAAMFVYGGLDSVRNPQSKVPKARVVTEPLTDAIEVHHDPFPNPPITKTGSSSHRLGLIAHSSRSTS